MDAPLESLRNALRAAQANYRLAPGIMVERRKAYEDALFAYYEAANQEQKGAVTYQDLESELGISTSRITQMLTAARRRASRPS